MSARRHPPVLIVDDDAATREALAEALEMSGYDVRVARGGKDALCAASRERPGAVIVDLLMPEMSGTEVIARLRALPGLDEVCAILATAWPDVPSDLDRSVFVVRKPFAVESVLAILERARTMESPPSRGSGA